MGDMFSRSSELVAVGYSTAQAKSSKVAMKR